VKDPSSAASRHGRHPSRWANGETDPLDHWRFALKRRSILGITMALAAMVAFTGSVLAFPGLSNGGFEDGTAPVSGYDTLLAGSTALAPWTITSGDVEWIADYWQPAEGTHSLDLSGNGPGVISQTIDTTVNKTYVVTFMLAGNPDGGPTVKTLTVGATGATSADYSFDTTGRTRSAMGWVAKGYSFKATSATTVITFTNPTADSPFGPALDGVIVTETLGTGAQCKNSGWKTMVDSVGTSFKNQGDCVSFFATEGNNLGAGEPAL
jgi:choice-of-anchor C domain-containing protein